MFKAVYMVCMAVSYQYGVYITRGQPCNVQERLNVPVSEAAVYQDAGIAALYNYAVGIAAG
jgi:hypothetical protein